MPQFRGAHVAKLALVQLVDGLIEFLQLLQTLRGDARLDHAAVVGLTLAGDATLLFEPVEQPRHIGVTGNHAVTNHAAGKSFGCSAPENAEDVVLRGGEAAGLDHLFSLLGEAIGNSQNGNEESIFERGDETMGPGTHGDTIVV